MELIILNEGGAMLNFINHTLPDNLKGRSIHAKVIPTMCNLKNMLDKLVSVCGDTTQLKQWQKRSYKAYKIDDIKSKILNSDKSKWRDLIREHILSMQPCDIGASLTDIYLVAYVAENFGEGKDAFFKYVKDTDISDKENTANAIWQVGKGDGVYLGILYDDGRVKDWDFILKWIHGK